MAPIKRLKITQFSCNFVFLCYYKEMSQTYQPKKRKRKKTHGFLVWKRTSSGRNVLRRRRRKGRKRLAV